MKKYHILILAILCTLRLTAQEDPKVLEEVVIKQEAKAFSIKNGNIKVDVANTLFKANTNPVDLISKLPGIQVSPDRENITVVGKGNALIYIDNQRVTINDLNALTVEDIKTIEIIQNPSSKYDADGRAVILITRKRTKKEGFMLSLTENATFKRYFNNYLGGNTSYKKGNIELKANFNYNQLTVWESNGNDFSIPDKDIVSNYLVTAVTKRPQYIYGAGIFYKINDDDNFSFSFNGKTDKDLFDITTDTYNRQQNDENNIATLNQNNGNRQFYNAFMNYNHKIKSMEALLFTGIQYSGYTQKTQSQIFNNYNNTTFDPTQNRDQRFHVDLFSGRMDFEKPFKNQMKLELGIFHSQAAATTDFNSYTFNPEAIQASSYHYKEKNSAGYFQFSGSFKKINYSLGTRVENTIVEGKYKMADALLIDKNYTRLFPKLQLEIPVDSTKTLTLNYAKSISRPDFLSASQVTAYINPYFSFANNINIDPTITNEISANFQYGNKLLKISYNQKDNPVYMGSTYDDTQNMLTLKPVNFEKESGYSIELTTPFTYKIWTATNVLNLTYNKIEDPGAVLNGTRPYLYYYSNHTFKLPKAIELMVNAWGITRQQEGIFERKSLFTIDAAVSKTFWKHFDCTLSCNDIFRQLTFYDSFTVNNVTAKGRYYTDLQMLSLTVKYSFGKISNSEFKEKSIDENANRIR